MPIYQGFLTKIELPEKEQSVSSSDPRGCFCLEGTQTLPRRAGVAVF